MSLKLKIEQEIKTAMLQKNKDRLRALRAIKSLILLSETEKGFFGELDSETETKLLSKAAKQRRDSLTIFQVQNRPDLVAVEQGELQVIEEFLPKPLTNIELQAAVGDIIKELGASSPQDMGRVMGVASKVLSGKVDGKNLAEVVKELLSK
ncbi:MAG: GatB/YqeY domain-containing protein [Flammeovirgaceae bacterium]|jgi:uncharacterized protein|nr:GatB/YqeY domain-containing protein [Flammeovirgaceae bacterium]|tara:strand:+ start:114798 stop:115250 length:453 start_codon:yes stop_codon:yes gene_type:complete